MPSRLARAAPAVALLLCACREPSATEVPPPSPPAPPVRLLSADALVPGQDARIRGTGLLALDTLWVDRFPVTDLRVESDSEAVFRMPELRPCEADGRKVLIAVAGGSALETRIRLHATVTMAVGESRVLTAADLQCLRLPARDEDFVLSVANTSLPVGQTEQLRTLLQLRTLPSHPSAGESGGQGQSGALRVAPYASATHLAAETQPRAAGIPSDAPVPFDPRYASAAVGDTVDMVAWSWDGAEALRICGLPRGQVPTFPALVLAVAGNVVAAVDLRVAPAPAVLAAARSGWLQTAVNRTAAVLLPTMRSIFDPDFRPLAGGGGRYWILFTSRESGHALDGHLPGATGGFQADCAHASEMTVMSAPATMLDNPARDVSLAAKFYIHEYAHSAEMITVARHALHYSSLWAEPWAVLAEETAARIATSQFEGARLTAIPDDMPWPGNAIDVTFWGRDPHRSPWQLNGRYSTGANMLVFLRELAGEVIPEHGRSPTMYQRLMARAGAATDPRANIDRVAAELGIGYVELTDQWMLASVTAGMLAAATADAQGLPRFRSWDLSDSVWTWGPYRPGFPTTAHRGAATERTLRAAAGNHDVIYLPGRGEQGISLQLVNDGGGERIIRLTRLR